jgi:hypothetical protein
MLAEMPFAEAAGFGEIKSDAVGLGTVVAGMA